MSPHRLRFLASAIVLLAPLAVVTRVATSATDAPVPGTEAFDCGTLALYQVLRLEGRSPRLLDVAASLPPPTAGGFSMRELQVAAGKCGLRLKGVRVETTDRAPDRPLLAYLRRGPHGHFVVVRPVGWTGKLVQVLDFASSGPQALDAEVLYASPEWSGLALIPERRSWRSLSSTGALLVVLSSIAVVIHRYRRGDTPSNARMPT